MALPTAWRVLLNNVDISTSVEDISDIGVSLDIEEPTEFNANNARLLIKSPFPADLDFKARVVVFAGSERIFSGRVLTLEKDIKEHFADVVVGEISQDMRNKLLENFGISKRVRVTKVSDTDSGEYPFTDVLAPVSDKSLIDGRVGSDSFATDIIAADDADNDDPINFGNIQDTKIDSAAIGNGAIYILNTALSHLTIKISGEVNLPETVFVCRYSATLPNADNLTTHGTRLFRYTARGRTFDTEGTILNPGANLSFWIYPEAEVTVSDFRMVLDLGTGATQYLNIVDQFVTEGNLDPTNINYDEDTLRSEGESLAQNPDVTVKAPYRWKNILFLVNAILDYYGIENSVVLRDLFELTEDYFSTNGRIGYDLENNVDPANPFQEGVETAIFWTGYPTDFLVDDDKFYFLYSSRLGNPSIIEYDGLTDTYREVYKRSSHAEWWKFVKDGDNFYILSTTRSSVDVSNPVLGAYDPTEPSPATLIEQLDISTNTLTTLIPSNHANKPVVGMYYQMGFDPNGADDNVRQGIQPDTRKSFILHNSLLYYIYANNLSCGIARTTLAGVTNSFVVIPRDSYFNHLGLDFTINGNVLYGAATFQKDTQSSRIVYKKSL